MAKTAPTKTEKPVPSQLQVDDIREDVATTGAEPKAKPDKSEPTTPAPFPTQADLDAMKAGTYSNREMKSR